MLQGRFRLFYNNCSQDLSDLFSWLSRANDPTVAQILREFPNIDEIPLFGDPIDCGIQGWSRRLLDDFWAGHTQISRIEFSW